MSERQLWYSKLLREGLKNGMGGQGFEPFPNLLQVVAVSSPAEYWKGLSNPILAKDIEVLRDDKGKPVFNALNGVNKAILDLGITKSHVSLSDEKHYALAFAILEIWKILFY